MKKIAIIGTGLSGLKAGLELARLRRFDITFWEKSRSVGGRVATRRFESGFVNHGADDAETFKDLLKAENLFPELNLMGEATGVMKALRDLILEHQNVRMNFSSEVSRVEKNKITLTDGSNHHFDHILLTAPMPQINKLLGFDLLDIQYDMKILFIGPGQKIYLPDHLVNEHFDSSEDAIRAEAEKLGIAHQSLELKKWRYANVLKGISQTHQTYYPHFSVAGDGFDPHHQYGLKAAWSSGKAVAQDMAQYFHANS